MITEQLQERLDTLKSLPILRVELHDGILPLFADMETYDPEGRLDGLKFLLAGCLPDYCEIEVVNSGQRGINPEIDKDWLIEATREGLEDEYGDQGNLISVSFDTSRLEDYIIEIISELWEEYDTDGAIPEEDASLNTMFEETPDRKNQQLDM